MPKNALLFLASMSMAAVVASCADQTAAVREKNLQDQADKVVRQIEYVKDPRTRLCLLVYAGPWSTSVSSIPCDSVPDGIIKVGRMH